MIDMKFFNIQKDSTYLKGIYPGHGWSLLSLTSLVE